MKKIICLSLLALEVFGCSHDFIGIRRAQYTEKWNELMSQQLAEEMGPGYAVTITEGSETGVSLPANGFTYGSHFKRGKWVTEFSFYMQTYSNVHYAYSYTGPTSGSVSTNFSVTSTGFDLTWGYQLGHFRPLFGVKRDTFTMMSGGAVVSGGNWFGLGGLGYETPISKNTSLAFIADYATVFSKPSEIKSAEHTSVQINFKWGVE
jgi:hypothetical protein